MKLLQNTIKGLQFGLTNFDAVETDLRLTKDNKIVIHHDPFLKDGRLISELNEKDIISTGVPSLMQFLQDETTQRLLKNKTVWAELKPNCMGKRSISIEIANLVYDEFSNIIENTNTPKNSFRMLSFNTNLLNPFVDEYKVYPILPAINECNPSMVMISGLYKVLRHSLYWHVNNALSKGYKGLLFAREYLFGIFSKRHPSYQKMVELMDETGIELGTNLGDYNIEHQYPRFHRFTDQTFKYPRYSKPGEGMIIAHRGTGTKGVEIPD